MSIVRDCKEYCLRNNLLSCEEILVGVSGGADSMCLLDLLYKILHTFYLYNFLVLIDHILYQNLFLYYS